VPVPFFSPFRGYRTLLEVFTLAYIVVTTLMRGGQRGIALDLSDGNTAFWPLGFNAESEMLNRLSAATGKPIEGK
jgi:hypothetical protein